MLKSIICKLFGHKEEYSHKILKGDKIYMNHVCSRCWHERLEEVKK